MTILPLETDTTTPMRITKEQAGVANPDLRLFKRLINILMRSYVAILTEANACSKSGIVCNDA